MPKPLYAALASAGLLLTTFACSSAEQPTGPAQAPMVAIADNSFSPNTLQVEVGTNVRWEWGGANVHNVTFDNGDPGSMDQSSGTFRRAFDSPGLHGYHCSIHGAQVMSGQIAVAVASDGGGGGTGGPYAR